MTPQPGQYLPALIGLFTAPYAPRWTVRRCANVPLWWAWVVHWLGGVLTTAAGLIVWGATAPNRFGGGAPLLYDWTAGEPFDVEQIVLMTASVLGGELVLLVIAAMLSVWAARPERLGATFRHALRVVWIHLPAVSVPVTMLLTATFNVADTLSYRWAERVIFWSMTASGLWVLWALLRAASGRPPAAEPIRDPLCDRCGYNLTHLPDSGRCPECGFSTERSLDPASRPMTDWHRARGLLRLTLLLPTGLSVVLQSRRFFRSLPARTGRRDACLFAVGQLHLTFVAMFVGYAQFWVFLGAVERYGPDLEDFIEVVPWVSTITVGLAVLALLGTGALVGLFSTPGWPADRTGGRNALPTVSLATLYASAWLPAWAFAQTLVMDAMVVAGRLVSGRMEDTVMLSLFFGGLLLGWLVLIRLILIATRAMRFANH